MIIVKAYCSHIAQKKQVKGKRVRSIRHEMCFSVRVEAQEKCQLPAVCVQTNMETVTKPVTQAAPLCITARQQTINSNSSTDARMKTVATHQQPVT